MEESPHWNLVAEIKEMMRRDWECSMEHIWRKNGCADHLAKKGWRLKMDVTIFRSPPQDMGKLLNFDLCGVTTPRMVAV